jgi:hypothetical protein
MAADDGRALARPSRPLGVIDPRRRGKNFQVKHAYFDNALHKVAPAKKATPCFPVTSPRLRGVGKLSGNREISAPGARLGKAADAAKGSAAPSPPVVSG